MGIDTKAMKDAFEAGFSAGSTTYAAAAHSWAGAVQAGCALIMPASTTVAASATALEGQLTVAFAQPSAIPQMETAFLAFGAAVGLGMAPAYAAKAPTTPVGFVQLFSKTRDSHSQAAADISNAITTWLVTGTAALVTPPGSPINWS